MTIDLYLLLATCVFYFIIPYLHNIPRVRRGGADWALGDRARHPDAPAWVERTERAHRNFTEWLPVFGIFVLVAHVTGAASFWTAAAAVAYFASRIAYTAAYMAGSRLRSPVWYVSSGCLLVILIEILRHAS